MVLDKGEKGRGGCVVVAVVVVVVVDDLLEDSAHLPEEHLVRRKARGAKVVEKNGYFLY